mmetsp:Transcript_12572/g.37617  ORF Transcript_12572/g.37617 Transcript_12572/m.37617 type:complete len:225 (-) Transcript_12572:306-980(-)
MHTSLLPDTAPPSSLRASFLLLLLRAQPAFTAAAVSFSCARCPLSRPLPAPGLRPPCTQVSCPPQLSCCAPTTKPTAARTISSVPGTGRCANVWRRLGTVGVQPACRRPSVGPTAPSSAPSSTISTTRKAHPRACSTRRPAKSTPTAASRPTFLRAGATPGPSTRAARSSSATASRAAAGRRRTVVPRGRTPLSTSSRRAPQTRLASGRCRGRASRPREASCFG